MFQMTRDMSEVVMYDVCVDAVVERSLTDMLRSSGDVLREAEQHDVLLRRRDGADMLLVEAKRAEALRDGFADAARIIASLSADRAQMVDSLVGTLPLALPWTQFLPEEDRREFLREFAATAAACAETGAFEPLAQFSREWRATALVYASPEIYAQLSDPADDEWRESEAALIPRPHA